MTIDEDENEELQKRLKRRQRRMDRGENGRSEEPRLLERVKATVPAMFPGPIPDDLPEQVQVLLAMRSERLRRFIIRFLIFIALPSVLVLFYTLFIATPRYVCVFQETYQVYAPTSSLAGAVTPSVATVTDAIDYGTVINQYIVSAAAAEKLDQQLHLRAYFSNPKIDWTTRLSKNATDAQYVAYYNKRVSVNEGFGGYLTVTVEGFDPAFTLQFANTINADADQMLDDMTSGARNAGVRDATQQSNAALNTLKAANDALTNFRNQHGDLDPSFIATQLGTIEGTLESQLATARAQLAQDVANLQPNASQIVQLKLQISGLEQQITAERERLADDNGTTSYSNTVAVYNNLLADQQLATTTYETAQQGLVIAQANATTKQNYVVDFVPPVLPDRPTIPSPLKSTALAFLTCFLLYGIMNMLFAAMRDQTGI